MIRCFWEFGTIEGSGDTAGLIIKFFNYQLGSVPDLNKFSGKSFSKTFQESDAPSDLKKFWNQETFLESKL